MALKQFIDDFAQLAIEQGLVQELPTLFTPDKVFRMQDDVVEDIAGENEESRIDRAQQGKIMATLTKALEVLQSLERSKETSKCILAPIRSFRGSRD